MAEHTAAATNIGAVIPEATDADSGDTLTYSMEGPDAASFNFNASTRQITTKAGVTYDHEAKSSYSVTIKVDDGHGGMDTVAVTITITDVDEPPSAPAAPTVSPTSGSTTSLTAGTSYQVQVRATNAEGDSGWSSPGTGTPGAGPPPPPPPPTVGTIPDQTLRGGARRPVDVAPYFRGAALTYTAQAADARIVTVEVSGSTVTLTPVDGGRTTVTVTAQGPGGTAAQTFAVDRRVVVAFAAAAYDAREGGPAVAVPVRLDYPAVQGLVMPITGRPEGSTAPGDYTVGGLDGATATAGTGTLTFPAGATEQTLTVTANADADGDDEAVALGVRAAAGGRGRRRAGDGAGDAHRPGAGAAHRQLCASGVYRDRRRRRRAHRRRAGPGGGTAGHGATGGDLAGRAGAGRRDGGAHVDRVRGGHGGGDDRGDGPEGRDAHARRTPGPARWGAAGGGACRRASGDDGDDPAGAQRVGVRAVAGGDAGGDGPRRRGERPVGHRGPVRALSPGAVPPAKTAKLSRRNPRSSARDGTIRRISKIWRRRWKKEVGYHRQARVENAFFRYKSILGDRLRSRTRAAQAVESVLACHVLNRMTELGRPESFAIDR